MAELDVLLTRYLDRHYARADERTKAAFATLLTLSDPELVSYLLHGEPAEQADLQRVIDTLRQLD